MTISRMGPTSCAMPPCTSTRLSCNFSPRFRGYFVVRKNLVLRKQAALADAEFRIAFGRPHSLNQLDSGPNAARILPAAAGSSQPFAEDGARSDDPAIAFFQRSGERMDLIRRAHAHRNQAGQQVGGDGQARAFGNVAHPADNFNAPPRADQPAQQFAQRFRGNLPWLAEPGRTR